MRRIGWICGFCLCLFFALPANAADPLNPKAPVSAEAKAQLTPLLDGIRDYYRQAGDFSVSFSQAFHSKLTKRVQISQGEVDFARPAKLNWRYLKPDSKSFISDGTNLWAVEAENKQVKLRKNLKTSELESSLAFLWGGGNLLADYDVRQINDTVLEGAVPVMGRLVLWLVPKQAASFDTLYLLLNAQTRRIEEVVMVDSLGNLNHLTFGPPKNNQKFPKAHFTFTAPDKSWTVELIGE